MSGKNQRMGMVIGVRPETLETYKSLHAAPWPAMNSLLSASAHLELIDLPPAA